MWTIYSFIGQHCQDGLLLANATNAIELNIKNEGRFTPAVSESTKMNFENVMF